MKYITGNPGGYGVKAGIIGANPQVTAVQLYVLSTDLGESKNLAAEKPEKLKEMQDQLAIVRGK